MAPLTVAGIGWVLVLIALPGDARWVNVSADAAGWALAGWGWWRLRSVQPAYVPAWRAASAAGIGSLVGLLPGEGAAVLALTVGYAGLAVVALVLGARALQLAAGGGGGHLAAGQASFLCWAGVGALVAGVVGSVGAVVVPTFGGLVLAATQISRGLALWFAVLQLSSARRRYVRPRGRR